MDNVLMFLDRAEFRTWLMKNCMSSEGVWLLFGKKGGPTTLSANDALEEALCYGWIDGQMKKIDEQSYKKYFANRRINSNWSEKNKKLVEKLEKQGIMTDYGRNKVKEAKENGQWDKPKAPAITEEDIVRVAALLKGTEPAFTNFESMSLSVRKTYTRAYLDAKTDAGREKRLTWMIERLNKNLKPM
ncbi:YdeI/OmpD-associated family protein [Enterococcus sp. AZ109]|uniref:YdeI/OmpD-associated family protein n=1 Tax=Enterococcus sp. AZ109 TaxID=2774634 RepID=UPI003F284B27